MVCHHKTDSSSPKWNSDHCFSLFLISPRPSLKSRFWTSVKRRNRLLEKCMPLLTSSLNVACGLLELLFRYEHIAVLFLSLSVACWFEGGIGNQNKQYLNFFDSFHLCFNEAADRQTNYSGRPEYVSNRTLFALERWRLVTHALLCVSRLEWSRQTDSLLTISCSA